MRERDVHEVLPERDRRRVARLQRDDAPARRVRERGVARRSAAWPRGRASPSASKSVRCSVFVSSMCWVSIPNCVPQSPRWFMRITRVAGELERAHDRVADHRRAQVPDVHLLGHVGRRVVDRDRLRRLARGTPRRGSASARVAHAASASGENARFTNPGPETSAGGQQAAGVAELLGHARGHVARRLAELLAQLHGEVGLQVEAGLARRRQQRVDLGLAGHALDGGGERRSTGRGWEPRSPL